MTDLVAMTKHLPLSSLSGEPPTFLDGSLYATYYGIDYEAVRKISKVNPPRGRSWLWLSGTATSNEFAELSASRAGVSLGTWDPATNGMIIEQQQILTTQNLAALFVGLDLRDALRGRLSEMAKQCFKWICRHHQMKVDRWHAKLIMLKNTAYAWRQMVFFLALLSDRNISEFLQWAAAHLEAPRDFRVRFQPALQGLVFAASGESIEHASTKAPNARRFLGWSKTKHWLLDTR